jgi:NADH-quinone oxidoreductase subunit G
VPFAWSPGWNSPQAWNKFQDEIGGHLRAGDPGMRLIEPKGDGLSWFTGVPKPFAPAAGQWLVVPLYHLFGSDETSALAAPIQERMGAAYVALAKAEAERLGVNDGALLSLQVAGRKLRLPLRIDDSLSLGVVGLPVGLADIASVSFGTFAQALQEATA